MPSARPIEAVGVVLAGGRSRRMGRDKALLEWRDGQTLLDRAIELLRQAGCSPIVVSGNRPGLDCVPDQSEFPGPVGGLQAVLHRRDDLAGRVLLIIPVDMPLLSSDKLRHLASVAVRSRQGAATDSGPLPIALLNDENLRRAVDGVMNGNGKRSLRELIEKLDLEILASDEHEGIDNVNDPEQLAQARLAAARFEH